MLVAEGSHSTVEYSIVYASHRVQKTFDKAFERIPKDDVTAIKAAIAVLRTDPRQENRKKSSIALSEGGLAQFRLRVGNYRIFYDLDHVRRSVVLLFVGRRNERTYR